MDRMNIPLDEKTRITSDAHNFVIEKLVGKKKDDDGNMVDSWVGKRFYTTIEGLLYGIHQQELRDTACTSVLDLSKAIDVSLTRLEQLKANITPIGGVNG